MDDQPERRPGVAITSTAHFTGPLITDPYVRYIESVIGPSSLWAKLLVTLHGSRKSSDFAARAELLKGLTAVCDKVWHALWKTSFIMAAARLLSESYFCGYTKQELTSP